MTFEEKLQVLLKDVKTCRGEKFLYQSIHHEYDEIIITAHRFNRDELIKHLENIDEDDMIYAVEEHGSTKIIIYNENLREVTWESFESGDLYYDK